MIIPVVILLALVFLGKIFDAFRVMFKKRAIISGKKDASQNKDETKAESYAIVEPSYKAYGFDSNVVDSAKYRYNGELKGQVLGGAITLRLQRGETIAEIANEYFEAYNVTRKTVYGLKPLEFTAMDEKEVAEMLWISFLIRGGSIYAHNDTPSYLNYLIHKALEEYKKNPDNVGKMVRTHVDRWWTINYWSSTSFKSFGAEGKTANSLPAQYLFTVEDLEELFRVPAFVKHYDGLGEEGRKAVYDDKLIPELMKYAQPLKAKAAWLGDRYAQHKIRIKKAIVKTKEYKDYVRFLEGEWKKEKPLFLKTYSDTIGFKGLGSLKTWLHTFRNLYQPLAIPFQVVIFALGAALYLQMNNPAINLNITMPLIAALVIGLTIALWSGRPIISFFLNRGFEKRVNTKAYGKPVGPSVGYKMPNIPLYLKLFRYAFWFTLLSIKGLWNTVVLYIVLYAHANIITGQWLILGMNFNMILVAGLWFPFILFFFLDTFSIYYAFEALWGYFQARFIGLGHIKTEGRKEALRRVYVSKLEALSSAKSRAEKEDLLVAMIKANFIPKNLLVDGKPLTSKMQDVVVAEIINLILKTLYDEDMISLNEYQANVWSIERKAGASFYDAKVIRPATFFSGLENSIVTTRVYRFLNQLFMEKPEMPLWENLKSLSIMTPTGPGEHIFYPWEGDAEVGLNVRMNTGHTPLTYMIKRHPAEWQNFLNRLNREGSIKAEDLATLKNITYGEVIKLSDEKLIMKLREWGSLRGQPYFRTLNGKFHYVPVLQLLAKMNHPEWGKEKVAEEVNKKYQIVWGTYLRTFENANNQDFKDKFGQISYILKKYFDEYGYFVELTDLAKYDENLKFGKGRNYNILQRYNPATGKIDDIIRVDLGTYYPFANEGKPGNQAHNRRFMRGEVLMNLDMNQDFYIEQAFSLPMLVNMFSENNGYYKNDEGKNVALVGYPEDIYTQDFSLSGKFHAVADRTFVGIVQRTLQTLGARFHYGHPDAWRASVVDAFGGVSRSYPVNEDIYGAYQMMLVGKKVLNIEFLEAGKGREVSWGGTDGILENSAWAQLSRCMAV
ncbi:MAG: hypothetical protein WC330_06865 [Candidatus Omnitrophota bacterium]